MTEIDPEGLRRRVYVVKVQAYDAAVIPTARASAACLLDQDPLDLLVAPRDGLADAALAPPTEASTSPVAVKLNVAVPFASANLGRACFRRRATRNL